MAVAVGSKQSSSSVEVDEVFHVANDRMLAAQVELCPAADRELDLGLLMTERYPCDDRESASDAAQDQFVGAGVRGILTSPVVGCPEGQGGDVVEGTG